MFTDIYTKLELDIKEYVIALSKYIHHISLIMDFALMKFNINEDTVCLAICITTIKFGSDKFSKRH